MADETVVLVHGLWMNGLDMVLLRRRLHAAGYITRRFGYSSVKQSAEDNARHLETLVNRIKTPRVHYVAHSLGGLVVRYLFHLYPAQPPGHIVTLGTPHQPSSAAMQLRKTRAGRLVMGKSLENALVGPVPSWHGSHPLGVIAGSMRMGLGIIIPGVTRPNDGTVAVSETCLDGMQDHITLPVSHFGLLFSRRVASQAITFLREGRFNHGNR